MVRVRHSKPVKALLAEREGQIVVFYLSSDCPELNPDENANADLKHAVIKLAPTGTTLQLAKADAGLVAETGESGRMGDYPHGQI